MTTRYVLLGDVVSSREIDDRAEFGARLREACRTVAEQHENAFDAPLEPLKGIDEIGGVLTTVEPLYDVLDTLHAALHPHELRVAVAKGVVDVGLDSGDVSQMDGPAFHRADDLLSELERGALRFTFDFQMESLDTAVADEVNLLFASKRRWTDREREVVESYLETGSQAETANALDISQAAVSQALSRASWPTVREIETRLRTTLQTV
ncbi:SatD family protein [Halobacterium noricense]|uniref:SatD family protein n=1 Tax=Halobacterium noricense TaxID=223182 RepID=UPI001E2CB5D9|nr:SatD family protein [Halobacterium noricense]UHH26264.1 SatD family protein [Halobacterium noricense]